MPDETDDVTTPALDTREKEAPDRSQTTQPGVREAAIVWLVLASATAVVNIVILAIAQLTGADLTANLAAMSFQITWITVLVATFAWLAFATFGWALLAHRVPALAHLWVPLHWGMALVAMGAIAAVVSLPAAIALGIMNLVTNGVAAHVLPRRLPH